MSISVFEHPFLTGLFGRDEEITGLFVSSADIAAMVRFEAALAQAQASLRLIPAAAASRISEAAGTFEPDIAALERAAARDGTIIPELVGQLRNAVGVEFASHVHFGATSQDVIDTSLILRLKRVSQILFGRIQQLSGKLGRLEATFGNNGLTAHTRMQPAIPIMAADRIASWLAPLANCQERLATVQFPVQFGGAAGTLEKFGTQGVELRKELAKRLDIADRPQWHNQRAFIADFGNLLSLISGSLGKFGLDIALMAQLGHELSLAGGGSSSAMSHKQNPVTAEVLVSLARFNAVQISGLHQAMVHEQERSGAAWMLEWMILPQMAATSGGALNLALALTDNIVRIGRH
ncbi:3-carboxy-cis,cis-muconate cycloisomerase [Phyllobacterium salinisoli]|uniref:3-carboxy-cis,cis-muconate cycloisomerase n=1 Tax=Phyllobacterium salinisoli TaxID=1899321 RepID=A0A368JY57_9HYPH|nr:3-carboxy-cis,cis-muconate cycloisomerase [Phyllobacterium salinisoli]RCS22067.1 3-carboxy-cis,cis-muconate cycloisomerase [Phyllobacterium salinisoli]